MEKSALQKIRRQFTALAETLPENDDAAAAEMLTAACASLMRLTGAMDLSAVSGEDTLDNLTTACGSVTKSIADLAARLPETPERGALELAQAQNAELLAQSGQIQNDLRQQTEENVALEENLRRIKDDYVRACSHQRRLKEELSQIYPERYESQLEAGRQAEAELEEKRRLLQEAEAACEAARQEHDRVSARLEQVQSDIAAIPEETRRRAEHCMEQERYLERLRKDAEEFGPDAQRKLQKEIDDLQPGALVMEEKIRALKNTLHTIQESHVEFDAELQKLETDVPARMLACLEELDAVLEPHAVSLREVRRTAETLDANLRECERLRQEYANWLDDDKTPLDALTALLEQGDPLRSELRRTLDPASTPRLAELYRTIRGGLEELDGILRACYIAAGKDQADIARRVSAGA